MSLHQTIFSNSIYRVLNILAQLLITIVVSRLMGVQAYGVLALLIAVAVIFNLFTSFGLEAGITYFIASKKFAFGAFCWLIGITTLLQLLLWFGGDSLYRLITGNHYTENALPGLQWPVLLILIISTSLTDKFTALFNGYHLYTQLNRGLLITNGLLLAVFAWLWWLNEPLPAGDYLLVYALGCLFQFIYLFALFRFRSGLRFSFDPVPVHALRSFGRFIGVVYLANCVQFAAYRADYWILDHYYPNKPELGWYALAVKLVQFFWIMPNLVASILFPHVAARITAAGAKQIAKGLRIMNGLNIVLGLISALLVHWLIPFFFGQAFEPSAALFVWLLPGTVLFCITTVLAAFFSGIEKPKLNLYGSLLCLLVVLVLDFLLIPRWGNTGAAIASTIAYSVATAYMLWRFCRISGQPPGQVLVPGRADVESFFHTIRQLIGKYK